jgi:hypothetical protein
MMTFPIYGKITNVPNHQPVLIDKSRNLNGWLFLVGSLDPFFVNCRRFNGKLI